MSPVNFFYLTFPSVCFVIISFMNQAERIINYIILITFFLSFSFSQPRLLDIQDKIHIIAVDRGFDFLNWTIQAVWSKFFQNTINSPHYFSTERQHEIVTKSIEITRDIEKTNNEIQKIYSDPSIQNPEENSAVLRNQLSDLQKQWETISPFAEAILEMQVTQVLSEMGLTTGGQPIPWVSYHITPLPQNLVISKREKIGAETNYIVTPLSIEEGTRLENNVDNKLGVSSLVVDIGGLAAYPTMIMRTTALDWLADTIAHEWTHIYLGQRPLGNNYNSPELRTMNETTASIAGKEVGEIVLKRYYPELALNENPYALAAQTSEKKNGIKTFDFREEMHTTRINADSLLSQGKIIEAEQYMESRRKLFWDNGYMIRKINQAYFAFYGSYADTPGGAAGEDPVGPAVRALRAKYPTLKLFLEKISSMTTFKELQDAVQNNPGSFQ